MVVSRLTVSHKGKVVDEIGEYGKVGTGIASWLCIIYDMIPFHTSGSFCMSQSHRVDF